MTTDYHCIDSYMQLSYCNLCAGQKELPCLSNCINVIESCLVNVSLINDVWINFIGKYILYNHNYSIIFIYLDSIENVGYFNNIENGLSSIGISISDALMTFFNSDGIQNKDVCIDYIDELLYIFLFILKIIDQCGHIHIRSEIFDNDQKFADEYSKSLSLSLLDRQLIL